MLETALNNASTATEVAALQAALTAAQEDISAILASNNVYTGALNITNAAELTFATELGSKVAIINGNVNVTVSTANGLDAADVSAVTSKIGSVVGSVTISTNADLDFSALTAVSGAYSVSGHDVDDSALASAGDVTLNYDGGYAQPALATAGTILLTDKVTAAASGSTAAVVGTLTVDFSGLTSATDLTTSSSASSTLALAVATSVKVGDTKIVSVTATKTTELHLGFDATLASLSVTAPAATAITVGAKQIDGATALDAKTGNTVSFPALTKAGAITSDAATVEAAALKTASSTITLSKATAVSLPALTSVAGAFSAASAVTFSTPVLAATNSVTLAAATSVEIASISDANLVTTNKVKTLTIGALATAFDASAHVELTSVNITGKTGATNSFTIGSANVDLASASFAGELKSVSITGAGTTSDKLTSVSTTGSIDSFTLDNSDVITSIDLGHSHISGGTGTDVVITNNAKLASLTTSTDYLKTLTVTGNAKLASLDASSYSNVISNATQTATITIKSNDLVGAYVKGVAATATTALQEAVIKSDDLLTLKSYVASLYTAATSTSTFTKTLGAVVLDLDLHDAGKIGTATTASALSAHMQANVVGKVDSSAGIDSKNEMTLVSAE